MHQPVGSMPQQLHLSWYNPLSWMGCLLRAWIQPDWFALQLRPLIEERIALRRLFIQLNLGFILLSISTIGAGYWIGLFVPLIGKFYQTIWWLHVIALIIPIVTIALVLQTAFDYQRAIAHLCGATVFIALYWISLLDTLILIQGNDFLFQGRVSTHLMMDIQLGFFAGFGWYNTVTYVIKHGQLRHKPSWTQHFRGSMSRWLLVVGWLFFLFVAHGYNLFLRRMIDHFFLIVALLIVLYTLVYLGGLLISILLVDKPQQQAIQPIESR
jgi:hypothetical protein